MPGIYQFFSSFLLLFLLSGCLPEGPRYREFKATVDFSRFQSFMVEGPRPPAGRTGMNRMAAYEDRLLEECIRILEAKGFEKKEGLAAVDMVVEMLWSSNPVKKEKLGTDPAERPRDIEFEDAFRLTVQVYDPVSGERFWANANGMALKESLVTEVSALNTLRSVLEPFPSRAE